MMTYKITPPLTKWIAPDESDFISEFGKGVEVEFDAALTSFQDIMLLNEHSLDFHLVPSPAVLVSYEGRESPSFYHLEATMQGKAPDAVSSEVSWSPELEDERVTNTKAMRFNFSLHSLQEQMFSESNNLPEAEVPSRRKLSELKPWPKGKKSGAYDL